jgi:hypothetical protein
MPTDDLRYERYVNDAHDALVRNCYYSLRQALPPAIRLLIHRWVYRRRLLEPFPSWPLDCSVDQILESLMQAAIQASGQREVRFIWFWPDGHRAAMMMTHDVETELGVSHCDMLMNLDESFGIKAAFQVVPEGRYEGVDKLIADIRARGFEANIHDLDHDGRLYESVQLFKQRARKINEHGQRYGLKGFRAGSMHRNQNWFNLLDFDYDMSVPNVAHMEPQGAGAVPSCPTLSVAC